MLRRPQPHGTRFTVLTAILFIACGAGTAAYGDATLSKNGLEVSDYETIFLRIDSLSTDAAAIHLTEDMIRQRVEVRLRSAGLKVKPFVGGRVVPYLRVWIGITGPASRLDVDFNRVVEFDDGSGKKWVTLATTWKTGCYAAHRNDAIYVLGLVDVYLDEFLNGYLKANTQKDQH